MNIPEPFCILDLRTNNDFKGITICGYKRTDVITTFQNSIINGKLEDALKWCVELHSTGLNKNIWDSLFSIYYKYINIHHLKLYLYLLKRYREYNKILKVYPDKKHELFSRNDQEIRHLFTELVVICTINNKSNLFLPKSLPKIDKSFYSKEEIARRMISKSIDSIHHFVPIQTDNDTKFALNEILSSLETSKATPENCIYWYMWLEKVDAAKKKDGIEPVKIERENLKPVEGVEEVYWGLWVWFLWNIILKCAKKKGDNEMTFIINKMYEDYKDDFKPCIINKKKYLFFCCYYILKKKKKMKILIHKPLIEDKSEFYLIQSCANINRMYKEVKMYNENNLSYDDKTTLFSEYSVLFNNITEMKKREKNIIEKRRLKDIQPIRDNFVSMVDPTKYPDLKALSKLSTHKDKVNIEYHNIIEDQARILEEQYEKEIVNGLKSRMRDTTNVKSMVERIRRRKETESPGGDDYDETVQSLEDDKDRKLKLFSQFVAFKKEDTSKHKSKDDKSSERMKTIEFYDKKRRTEYNNGAFAQHLEQYDEDKRRHRKTQKDRNRLKIEKDFQFDEGDTGETYKEYHNDNIQIEHSEEDNEEDNDDGFDDFA